MVHRCAMGLLLVAATGCQDSERAASPGDPPPRVVVAGDDADLGGDPYELTSAAITGHALTVSVSFAGGCQEHAFTLVIGDSFAESSPVQLPAVLKHDANGDRCEAWLTETHVFDLELIRNRYREAYGPGAGTVVLQLRGAPDVPDALVDLVYEFN